MNELMQSPALSMKETRNFDVRLAALLAWQTRKYTKGESTSVTVETARELLASLRYTIAVVTEETHIPQERLLTEELPPLIRQGQKLLLEKVLIVVGNSKRIVCAQDSVNLRKVAV